MRVNLRVPYAEKERAKALGARWDAKHKTWYVKNVPDLSEFSRWLDIKELIKAQNSPKRLPPVETGVFKPLCWCDALPWEDCEHSDRLAHEAMVGILDLSTTSGHNSGNPAQ